MSLSFPLFLSLISSDSILFSFFVNHFSSLLASLSQYLFLLLSLPSFIYLNLNLLNLFFCFFSLSISLNTFVNSSISFPLLLLLNFLSHKVQLMRSSGVTVVFAALSPGLESLLSVHGVIRRASGHSGAEEETDIVIATADGALGTIPKTIRSIHLFLYLSVCVSVRLCVRVSACCSVYRHTCMFVRYSIYTFLPIYRPVCVYLLCPSVLLSINLFSYVSSVA